MRNSYVKELLKGSVQNSKGNVRKNNFDMYTHILVDTIIKKGL